MAPARRKGSAFGRRFDDFFDLLFDIRECFGGEFHIHS
ncbi:MAG: hypothetical protein ACI9ZM_003792, partial [Paracoccaceae bacterium]